MKNYNAGTYEAEQPVFKRPARYNQPDVQPARLAPWLGGRTKSSNAMLRGSECWTCTASLSIKGTNGIGPRYCGKCLKKKVRSVGRDVKLINKLIKQVVEEEQCRSQKPRSVNPFLTRKASSTE